MSTNNTELEKLDITQFIDGFLHALKRTWIIVLILTGMRNKRENQPPESLGLPYFREDR